SLPNQYLHTTTSTTTTISLPPPTTPHHLHTTTTTTIMVRGSNALCKSFLPLTKPLFPNPCPSLPQIKKQTRLISFSSHLVSSHSFKLSLPPQTHTVTDGSVEVMSYSSLQDSKFFMEF
ncbi:hypothetical protein GIB67_038645, partial [Kingdonia uniflora]